MSARSDLNDFLHHRGQAHRIDEILRAYRDGMLTYWLDQHGLNHLADTDLPHLLMLAHADEQYEQCRRWRDLLRAAGYTVRFSHIDEPAPFDREWTAYEIDAEGVERQLATFDIDGCGASWHGPDDLWLDVIGPSEGVTN